MVKPCESSKTFVCDMVLHMISRNTHCFDPEEHLVWSQMGWVSPPQIRLFDETDMILHSWITSNFCCLTCLIKLEFSELQIVQSHFWWINSHSFRMNNLNSSPFCPAAPCTSCTFHTSQSHPGKDQAARFVGVLSSSLIPLMYILVYTCVKLYV